MASNKFIDIGINLTDGMFKGRYGGRPKHESDLDDVIKRAFDNNMEKMIITGGKSIESLPEHLLHVNYLVIHW